MHKANKRINFEFRSWVITEGGPIMLNYLKFYSDVRLPKFPPIKENSKL